MEPTEDEPMLEAEGTILDDIAISGVEAALAPSSPGEDVDGDIQMAEGVPEEEDNRDDDEPAAPLAEAPLEEGVVEPDVEMDGDVQEDEGDRVDEDAPEMPEEPQGEEDDIVADPEVPEGTQAEEDEIVADENIPESLDVEDHTNDAGPSERMDCVEVPRFTQAKRLEFGFRGMINENSYSEDDAEEEEDDDDDGEFAIVGKPPRLPYKAGTVVSRIAKHPGYVWMVSDNKEAVHAIRAADRASLVDVPSPSEFDVMRYKMRVRPTDRHFLKPPPNDPRPLPSLRKRRKVASSGSEDNDSQPGPSSKCQKRPTRNRLPPTRFGAMVGVEQIEGDEEAEGVAVDEGEGFVDPGDVDEEVDEIGGWSDVERDDAAAAVAVRRSGRNTGKERQVIEIEDDDQSESDDQIESEEEVQARPKWKALSSNSSRQTSRQTSSDVSTFQGMRTRKGKGRAGVAMSSREDTASVASDMDWQAEEEEDELEEESDYSEDEKRKKRPITPEDENLMMRHRLFCDKCGTAPVKPGTKYRQRLNRDILENDAQSEAERRGGWLECETCSIGYHWGCSPMKVRADLLKNDKQRPKSERLFPGEYLEIGEVETINCTYCSDWNLAPCFVCRSKDLDSQPGKPIVVKDIVTPRKGVPANEDGSAPEALAAPVDDDAMEVDVDETSKVADSVAKGPKESIPAPEDQPMLAKDEDYLFFRCGRCKRAAHYQHLDRPGDLASTMDINDIADYYQPSGKVQWHCHQCLDWVQEVDQIIAWRPSPGDAVEPAREADELPDHKSLLPREYLVKWKHTGFRHLNWVPHLWLLSTAMYKLLSFLKKGCKLDLETETHLAARGEDEAEEDVLGVSEDVAAGPEVELEFNQPKAEPEAAARIPRAWSTVDRILDVKFTKIKGEKKRKKRNPRVVRSDDEEDGVAEDVPVSSVMVDRENGHRPDLDDMVDITIWEATAGRELGPDDAAELATRVAWCYVKWEDLQYDQSEWDTPPPVGSDLWPAFVRGFKNYLFARTVLVPPAPRALREARDNRLPNTFVKHVTQPACVVGGQLMPFQIEGFNWLASKWQNKESCILADDMGLGKTIQIAALLGYLTKEKMVFPALVVVPNSTLTNWVREFEKWVPHVRVVPYFGSAASRKIIRQMELFQIDGHNYTLRAHVVLTSYETITGGDITFFRKVPRWEVLVSDEGQRLKGDNSLAIRRLKELKPLHRILMTGTPLNNRISETLNLLNFLDPESWPNPLEQAMQYDDPTAEDEHLFTELRLKIAPYLLRRRKEDVLDLKSKNEIIVPLSMRPLQKQVYKSVLSHNKELMLALRSGVGIDKMKKNRTLLRNVFMQLRKCLQHPYLNDPELEDRNQPKHVVHQALIDASAKLRFLKTLLPKLKARGHRVLLFSQFKIALDIIQEFCDGEGIKHLRLDGDTPQPQRQKDIDLFNAKGSDYFMYMLSTRAGGVGINLATADAVIIADMDWNPHQDIQAIARAYRYGQHKKVLVFRLMMENTVEEKIAIAGKKKMMLDHLIVQKMAAKDDEESDFAQILLEGAAALFRDGADAGENDRVWDSKAIDDLIDEVESREEEPTAKSTGLAFAPIYDSQNKKVVELAEDAPPIMDAAAEKDIWEDMIKKAISEQKQKEVEQQLGKGMRGRAAVNYNQKHDEFLMLPPTPDKDKRQNSDDDSASEYDENGEPVVSEPDDEMEGPIGDLVAELLEDSGARRDGAKGKHKRPKQPFPQAAPQLNPPIAGAVLPQGAPALPSVAAQAPFMPPPPGRQPEVRYPRLSPGVSQEIRNDVNKLGLYHLSRLLRIGARVGLAEQVRHALHYMAYPLTPVAEQMTLWKAVALAVDNLIIQSGGRRTFQRSKTVAEVQAYLTSRREIKNLEMSENVARLGLPVRVPQMANRQANGAHAGPSQAGPSRPSANGHANFQHPQPPQPQQQYYHPLQAQPQPQLQPHNFKFVDHPLSANSIHARADPPRPQPPNQPASVNGNANHAPQQVVNGVQINEPQAAPRPKPKPRVRKPPAPVQVSPLVQAPVQRPQESAIVPAPKTAPSPKAPAVSAPAVPAPVEEVKQLPACRVCKDPRPNHDLLKCPNLGTIAGLQAFAEEIEGDMSMDGPSKETMLDHLETRMDLLEAGQSIAPEGIPALTIASPVPPPAPIKSNGTQKSPAAAPPKSKPKPAPTVGAPVPSPKAPKVATPKPAKIPKPRVASSASKATRAREEVVVVVDDDDAMDVDPPAAGTSTRSGGGSKRAKRDPKEKVVEEVEVEVEVETVESAPAKGSARKKGKDGVVCQVCKNGRHFPAKCPLITSGPATRLEAIKTLKASKDTATLAIVTELHKRLSGIEAAQATSSPSSTKAKRPACLFCLKSHIEGLSKCVGNHGGRSALKRKIRELRALEADGEEEEVGRVEGLEDEYQKWPKEE